MRVKSTFKVVARCKVYDRGDNINYKDTRDIELDLDIKTAGNFLLRFAPYAFQIDGYKVIFHMNQLSADGLQMMKDDEIYVVTNFHQLMSDIHQGYLRLNMIDKFNDIMEFDFSNAYDDIEDEFDEGVE